MKSIYLSQIISLLLVALLFNGWIQPSEAEEDSTVVIEGARTHRLNSSSRAALTSQTNESSKTHQTATQNGSKSINSKSGILDVRSHETNPAHTPKYLGTSKKYSAVVLEGYAKNNRLSQLVESHNISESPPSNQTGTPSATLNNTPTINKTSSTLEAEKQKLAKLQKQLKLLLQGNRGKAATLESTSPLPEVNESTLNINSPASEIISLNETNPPPNETTYPETTLSETRTNPTQGEIITVPEPPLNLNSEAPVTPKESETAEMSSQGDETTLNRSSSASKSTLDEADSEQKDAPQTHAHRLPSKTPQKVEKISKGGLPISMDAADSFYRARKWQLALSAYKSLDTKNMNENDKSWRIYQIANCYRALKDFTKAKEKYRELISGAPDNFWAKQATWFLKDVEWWEHWVKQIPPSGSFVEK